MLKLTKFLKLSILLTGFLTISLGHQAKAQFFDGGPIVGLVASQIDGDKIEGYDKANLKLGLFIERKLRRRRKKQKWNYGTELYYIGKGSSTKNTEPVNSSLVIKLHYIELSPYLTYRLDPNMTMDGGIAIGALLSNSIVQGLEEGESKEFDSFDLNYFIGFKYHFTKHIALDLRVQRSLTPFASVDTSNSSFNKPGLRNILLLFSMYYKL